ncbi:hypothetical protein C8A01DRAFT_34700 [Parachaetomium inaequale]|uniref:Uncharacterized protein n=1 Tax=Parachaetomium inaequale TaxID=2588326 RepID=A0AAN6PHW9_9PEZI|nr:hypothetical protein C8A01DRAFT_34700 [Parachaetomium inaequale]
MGCRASLFSLAAAVTSLQAVSAAAVDPRDAPALIRWEGPVFAGERDKTLYVTDVGDLWNKVLDMNPQWVAEVADLDETNHEFGVPSVCGADSGIATGNSDEVTHILTRLRALKGYWTLGAGRCHRLGCGQNTGVYWCNDNAWGIRTSAKALYLRGSHIRDICCHRRDGSLYSGDPMSGVEAFPDNDPEAAHSRVAVGYGSCVDNNAVLPLVYTFPGKLGACRA